MNSRQLTLGSRIFFFGLLLGMAYLTYQLVEPYIFTVIFSLAAVIVLKPLYDWVLRWRFVRGNWAGAVALTIIIVALGIVVPASFVGQLVVSQIGVLLDDLPDVVDRSSESLGPWITQIEQWQANLPAILGSSSTPIDTGSITRSVVSGVGNLLQLALSSVSSAGSALPEAIAALFIFFSIFTTVLPRYEELTRQLARYIPLEPSISQMYLDKVASTVQSMVMGIFVIALVQGLTMGVFFWIAAVPYAALLTLVAIVFSVLPLGVNTVALPVAIYLLLSGQYWQGVLVALGGLIVVANLDNIIRPRLVSKDAYLHPALVLLSTFGGLGWFGFWGVVYGPVLMVLFVTTLQVYADYYSSQLHDSQVANELVELIQPSEPAPSEVVAPTTKPAAPAEPVAPAVAEPPPQTPPADAKV
jgi:predicted PurR-regulated permease PerM